MFQSYLVSKDPEDYDKHDFDTGLEEVNVHYAASESESEMSDGDFEFSMAISRVDESLYACQEFPAMMKFEKCYFIPRRRNDLIYAKVKLPAISKEPLKALVDTDLQRK